jgi:CheY-like chemotaxis protein
MARSLRILFVEDDVATREGYVDYLGARGMNVVPAATGREALTLAATSQLDAIVLDLGLPDVDGWEVARRLKASPATSAVPIIALTGADLPHEQSSALRAGCDWHLAKPCAPGDVLRIIQRAVAAARGASKGGA